MATTTLSTKNAALIQESREAHVKEYHDELSKKIRDFFAGLSDQDIEYAVSHCTVGRKYIIEFPISDLFEEENYYDIDNIIRMDPLFKAVSRVLPFKKGETKMARVWLKGDIRKFLPENHKLYHNGKSN